MQPTDRAVFIRRTYAHLAGAILAFVGLEAVLLRLFTPEQVFGVLAWSPIQWPLVLEPSWPRRGWPSTGAIRDIDAPPVPWPRPLRRRRGLIFLPLLSIAANYYGPKVIPTAAILTLATFAGLTLSVFVTRKDFSFLGPILTVGSLIALVLIVVAIFVGFDLGTLFSAAMVILMSGYILYYTSNVMLHYRTDQHVAAALALFAAIATLFYYILEIVMRMNRR